MPTLIRVRVRLRVCANLCCIAYDCNAIFHPPPQKKKTKNKKKRGVFFSSFIDGADTSRISLYVTAGLSLRMFRIKDNLRGAEIPGSLRSNLPWTLQRNF